MLSGPLTSSRFLIIDIVTDIMIIYAVCMRYVLCCDRIVFQSREMAKSQKEAFSSRTKRTAYQLY